MTAARHAHCLLCGPVHGHHPTRRPSTDAPYFDAALRLWLCSVPPHGHHARAHEALRDLGLDLLPESADPLAYRLQVLAVHAGLCADAGVAFAVADPTASRGLQILLLDAADALGWFEERAS